MEAVGSRLGRASSRYGPATAVFNGPVRKWKKKWVHVSSSSTISYQNPQSQSNGHSTTTNGGSRLLLCRWTPISPTSTATAADTGDSVYGSGDTPDEPPRRKYRYTPIAVLEEQKKMAEKKLEDEAKTSETDQYTAARPLITSDEMHGKPNIDEVLKKETEVVEKNGSQPQVGSSISNLDLGLGLKGQYNLDDQTKETQVKRGANTSGFGRWVDT